MAVYYKQFYFKIGEVLKIRSVKDNILMIYENTMQLIQLKSYLTVENKANKKVVIYP